MSGGHSLSIADDLCSYFQVTGFFIMPAVEELAEEPSECPPGVLTLPRGWIMRPRDDFGNEELAAGIAPMIRIAPGTRIVSKEAWQRLRDQITEARTEIERLLGELQWVSVAEAHPPRPYEPVLASFADESASMGRWDDGVWFFDWGIVEGDGEGDLRVLRWLSIPAQPEDD